MTDRPGAGPRIRRVYDPPEPEDGVRILVDRLWPRGLAKVRAHLDDWPKALTPSNELRSWFHEESRAAGEDEHALDAVFAEFRTRYLAELDGPEDAAAVKELRERLRAGGPVTLLSAVRDPQRSHVSVLVERLLGQA